MIFKEIKFYDLDCVLLQNGNLELILTKSVGPRVLSFRAIDGENLFAVVPKVKTNLPNGDVYHFRGGHRLWHAPEKFPRTYAPDNQPVHIHKTKRGCIVRQEVEADTGIEKNIEIEFTEHRSQVLVHHTLTNRGEWAITCAPWALTQIKAGGVAILPQSQAETGLLPNRRLTLWPYTKVNEACVQWGDRYILLHAELKNPFKVGFPNPSGWLAYWLDGSLFVKKAVFQPEAEYCDHGSSSECYCDYRFIELETLAPISIINPQESVTHTEIWELYRDIEKPLNEDDAAVIGEMITQQRI